MNSDQKRVSEILGGIPPDVPITTVDNVLGIDIVIEKIEQRVGDFGEYVLVQIAFPDGTKAALATGGKVVVQKLLAIREHLPVIARFNKATSKKGRSYYDVS